MLEAGVKALRRKDEKSRLKRPELRTGLIWNLSQQQNHEVDMDSAGASDLVICCSPECLDLD